MRKTALAALLVAGCGPTLEFTQDELQPFRGLIEPDGTRTWSFVLTPLVRDYYSDRSGEELLAQTMGANQFCPDGYEIRTTEPKGDSVVYSGVCR